MGRSLVGHVCIDRTWRLQPPAAQGALQGIPQRIALAQPQQHHIVLLLPLFSYSLEHRGQHPVRRQLQRRGRDRVGPTDEALVLPSVRHDLAYERGRISVPASEVDGGIVVAVEHGRGGGGGGEGAGLYRGMHHGLAGLIRLRFGGCTLLPKHVRTLGHRSSSPCPPPRMRCFNTVLEKECPHASVTGSRSSSSESGQAR